MNNKQTKVFSTLLFSGLLIGLGALNSYISKQCAYSSNKPYDSSNNLVYVDKYTDGINARKVVGVSNYQPKTEYYESILYENYKNTFNFNYPSINNNYQNPKIRFLTDKFGNKIDAAKLVFNEKTNSGQQYNDPEWILNEINNGSLKKHYAADGLFGNKLLCSQTQSVEFNFSTARTGLYATGLYAPPGEVVTLTFSEESWEVIQAENWSGIEIIINNHFENIIAINELDNISNRYPYMKTTFKVEPKNRMIKFGSPFGGSISIHLKESLIDQDKSLPTKFRIDNAFGLMYYQHGLTTKQNWKEQQRLVKQNKLVPSIQVTSSLFSIDLINETLRNNISTFIDSLVYPGLVVEKWNDVLYLANLYANNDQTKNIKKIKIVFSDDVLTQAFSSNSINSVNCSSDLGINNFFVNQPDWISIWKLLEKINYNFQQQHVFFLRKSEPPIKQINFLNLATIFDWSKYRSTLNYLFDEDHKILLKYSSAFHIIKDILNKKQMGIINTNDEFSLYLLLLYHWGPKQYLDYIRWDAINHPSWISNWTGIQEIKTMSEYFKINYFPAFFDYEWYWNDWTNQTALSQQEKEIVEQISNQYPAVDFVANLYACGIYQYDYVNQTYHYDTDFATPYEIIANKPFSFDLKNFIISTNEHFNWVDVQYPSTTKLGASLSYNPVTWQLIYSPNKNIVNEIDEFDLSIIPGNWDNKPKNYVPAIKFKIKVKQVLHYPKLQTFTVNSENSTVLTTKALQTLQLNLKSNNYYKISFKFFPPKTGKYKFAITWAGFIEFKVNNQPILLNSELQNIFETELFLEKDLVCDFELYLKPFHTQTIFKLHTLCDGEPIQIISHALISEYDELVSKNPIELIASNQNEQYIGLADVFNYSLKDPQ